ncbi:MAG: hypothetical protein IKX63_07515 [Muribaculaceae bacterium]|nr:hypothetical protein [Muribaculaceae bacterium]
MKKRKTLILAILLAFMASVTVTSCGPYWYDDCYYYDYPYVGPGGPPPPPPHHPGGHHPGGGHPGGHHPGGHHH